MSVAFVPDWLRGKAQVNQETIQRVSRGEGFLSGGPEAGLGGGRFPPRRHPEDSVGPGAGSGARAEMETVRKAPGAGEPGPGLRPGAGSLAPGGRVALTLFSDRAAPGGE